MKLKRIENEMNLVFPELNGLNDFFDKHPTHSLQVMNY